VKQSQTLIVNKPNVTMHDQNFSVLPLFGNFF